MLQIHGLPRFTAWTGPFWTSVFSGILPTQLSYLPIFFLQRVLIRSLVVCELKESSFRVEFWRVSTTREDVLISSYVLLLCWTFHVSIGASNVPIIAECYSFIHRMHFLLPVSYCFNYFSIIHSGRSCGIPPVCSMLFGPLLIYLSFNRHLLWVPCMSCRLRLWRYSVSQSDTLSLWKWCSIRGCQVIHSFKNSL